MFSFSPVFLLSLSHKVGRFFTKFPPINRQLPCSTELAFKREGNCNVMVTRPINYMISARDHSHDPDTWPTNFILTSRHHQFQLPYHHLFRHQVIIDSNIRVTIPMSWLHLSLLHHWRTRLSPIVDLGQVLGGLPGRLLPDSSGGSMRGGFPQSLLMKATERLLPNQRLSQFQCWWRERGFPRSLLMKTTGGSHGEWWAGRLAGRSISPTLEDVNIIFNHPPYYPMGRGDGRVVTDKRVAW